MNRLHSILQVIKKYSIYLPLPLLVGIFPALFFYGNNANMLLFSSLLKTLLILIGGTLVIYILFCIMFHKNPRKASLSSFIFLLFFHTYGIVFSGLRTLDIFQVEHFTLLPVYILMGLYTSLIFSKVNDKHSRNFYYFVTSVALIMTVFCLYKIIPLEVRKIPTAKKQTITPISSLSTSDNMIYPDVYYIVFDEMSGFDIMHEYWGYNDVDTFVNYLESKGFYVAEKSKASSTNTYHELANRLNYESYPFNSSDYREYWNEDLNHIANNKVMDFFKSLGYTDVVFDEGLPLSTKFKADIVYTSSMNELLSWNSGLDEFGVLVLNNTMFKPFITAMISNSAAHSDHERMLLFVPDEVNNLETATPKFVYIHLLIPHMPFLFDANGQRIDLKNQYDWDRYQGYYVFATNYAKILIDNILKSSDPNHPPVIVFSSDHGARNVALETGNKLLQNYPGEYALHIVNSYYLPGCPNAPLSKDINPINTFPVIFNCYFNTNIPLSR